MQAQRAKKRPACTVGVLLLLALLPAVATAKEPLVKPRSAAVLVQQGGPLIIAHRGASQSAPENTLPAFTKAVQAKADLIELDYYHSSDGVPIVFHDKTLKRTTNAAAVLGDGNRAVSACTLAELKRLDAGLWFNRSFSGTRIPTLDEALTLIQADSVTLIERKGGDAATCVKLLQQRRLVDKLVVQSFDWDFLRECHRLEPKLMLGALGGKPWEASTLDQVKRTGAAVVGWNHKHITQQEIQQSHQQGLKIWVYTVNTESRMRQLLEQGIDGIITDVPELGVRVRKSVQAP